jgi:uncharacterized membrane protein
MIGILFLVFLVAIFLLFSAHRRINDVDRRLAALERRLPPTRALAAEAPQPKAAEPKPAQAALPAAAPTSPPIISAPQPKKWKPAPERDQRSFEERFGTRWAVWVGGVALALGGVFLVQYSIEQGLIGPGMRILLGALFAAALIVAGEWARRNEKLSGITGIPTAHIPGILTAAGTTVAYADVYAAYGLYDFLAPAAAFILLGLVALATLAAALLHGPALAGLGLVGAYLAPLLVATAQPNYWALTLYLAVVTAASFALARARLWRWLAVTAVVFATLWTLPGINDVNALAPHIAHVVVGFALAAALIVTGFLFGPDSTPGRVDEVSSGGLAAYLLAAAALVLANHHDGAAVFAFAAVSAATVAIAWRTDAAAGAVLAAAVLAALVIADWALDTNLGSTIAPAGPLAGAVPEPQRAAYEVQLAMGAGFAALFGISGYLAQSRSPQPWAPMLWAASAVLAPIAILAALYSRIAGFERSIPFAGLALLLAVIYALATEALGKRAPRPGLAAAGAIFATGAAAALALALTLALEKGWLTIALALMVPGIAWVASRRPLPWLRWLAALLVVLVIARVGWEPRIVGRDVGTTPIFNWLLYGYGVPAVAFWLGGYLLRRRADDVPARITDAAAILFTVLFAFLEIRHYVNDGDIYRRASGLNETALQVCAGLAIAIGLERVRARSQSIVHDMGAVAVAALVLLAVVWRLLLVENPWWNRTPVDGLFFNLILLGYGIPAVLAGALALVTRQTRPEGYRTIAAVGAVVLALVYLSLEVTRFYRGPMLSIGWIGDAEQYTYSAVWLVFGVVLLFAGIFLRSRPVRMCSAAVVMLTVGKVFVIDMAGLAGVFRALSFIGLGVVLVGIAWLYQRLLFPPRAAATTAPGDQ